MNEKLAEGAPVTYVDGFAMAHYGGMFGEGSLCFGLLNYFLIYTYFASKEVKQ